VATGDFFRARKAADCEADHSPLSSAEVKDAQRYSSAPHYAFMAYIIIKYEATLPLSYNVVVIVIVVSMMTVIVRHLVQWMGRCGWLVLGNGFW
jgi:hypothetical protein